MSAVPVSGAPAVYDEAGRALPLGEVLGRGGEATVYRHRVQPEKAVKLYHRPDAARAEKLRQMIANAPRDPTRAHGHVSLAWPEALALGERSEVCGFVMPAADLRRAWPLHQLANPKARRARAPGISYRYLVRAARNLAAVVAALHEKGYVIGDLNESNVLISERALVTLVDCDSAQVRLGRRVFPCPVGKPEYTAPELQGAALAGRRRSARHDAFALAVLIFALTMEGAHPFAGVPRAGDPLALPEAIRLGRSPYLPRGCSDPAPTAPPLALLSPVLRRLLRRALSRGARPGARAWQTALAGLEHRLTTCPANANHLYGAHLRRCPWCERRERLGVEAFPGPPGPAPERPPAPLNPAAFARRFGALVALLLAVNLPLSWAAIGLSQPWQARLGWPPLGAAAAALAAYAPAAALLALGYRRARSSPAFRRGLERAEALLRAGLGATALIGGLLWLLGLAGGAAVGGDWLLGLSLWVLAFGLFYRVFR